MWACGWTRHQNRGALCFAALVLLLWLQEWVGCRAPGSQARSGGRACVVRAMVWVCCWTPQQGSWRTLRCCVVAAAVATGVRLKPELKGVAKPELTAGT